MDEYEVALQELKCYLKNPSFLSSSKEGEDLFLYLAWSTTVVSVALIREEKKIQLLLHQLGCPRS